MTRKELLDRISSDPNVCFWKPCIKGTTRPVSRTLKPSVGCAIFHSVVPKMTEVRGKYEIESCSRTE
jgi:hypothetical protein